MKEPSPESAARKPVFILIIHNDKCQRYPPEAKPQQGLCITSNNRKNQAVVRTRHSESKFNFFFIFCSIPMTATSHHTLQLAHAAGMLSALVHNEWAATESRTWEEVKNCLERYEISLPAAKETSCLLWEDSRAASFTHPYYQHYFTCKQTKENFKQSLTCYINSYTLYNYHQWVKIKISLQLRRDAVLVGSLGKQ